MPPSANPVLGLVVLLVVSATAGCVGVGAPDSPTTETTTPETTRLTTAPTTDATTRTPTTRTPTTTPSTVETTVQAPSNATAKRRALDAEERRVENLLANASNVSGGAGAYGRTEATVLDREEGVVRVRVVMSYSYEYACGERSGAADGLTTRATYRVTGDAVRLVEVEEGVRLLC